VPQPPKKATALIVNSACFGNPFPKLMEKNLKKDLEGFQSFLLDTAKMSDLQVYDFRFAFASFFGSLLLGWREAIQSLVDSGQLEIQEQFRKSVVHMENKQKITQDKLWSYVESHP